MFCQNKFLFYNEIQREQGRSHSHTELILEENDTHGLTEAPSCGII